MADIELIIKISEKDYEMLKVFKKAPADSITSRVYVAVANGTPLPKGHGVLKDFEKLYADVSEKEELARQRVIDTPSNSPCYMRYVAQLNERTSFKEMLYDAPTIIEADKAESEVEDGSYD